ncbi:MAG: phosphodiesterase [Thiotrichales bacterium]|nr:phosphodiesterase [Thiotrichales bacterium]
MLIAQVSDLHIRGRRSQEPFGVDNDTNFATAIDWLNTFSPRPDVVLLTGDLTNHGQPAEYQALAELLAALNMPWFVIPGNHDSRELMECLLPLDSHPARHNDFFCYSVEDYELRLVGLDTTLPKRHDGALCVERLEWLDKTLAREPQHPTLIFMHHPPFETGIWWMDHIGMLSGADKLVELLGKHPQVERLVSGHLHRAIHTSLGGVPASVCPSSAHQVHLDLTPEQPPHFIKEPAALQLHSWTGCSLVTHTQLIAYPAEPIDLRPLMSNWEERAELYRKRQPVPNVVDY